MFISISIIIWLAQKSIWQISHGQVQGILFLPRSTYTMANASDLVSRVILPSSDTNIPHSCVRVTPQGPVKAGIDYVVSPAP